MAMNFYGSVLTRPVIGPYRWNEDIGLLVRCGRSDRLGSCSDDSVSQYDIGLANGGKYLWSAYEQGYYGAINRLSQIGTYYDKWLAIESLAMRSWGTTFGNDEAVPLNFLPRATTPVLFINSRNDFGVPLETAIRPMVALHGAPGEHKRLVLIDGGHVPASATEFIREVLDWLDRYLGPVQTGGSGTSD